MTAFEFAEDAEALADAMRDAYNCHEGEATSPHIHPTALPFSTFERQIAFGRRFLQIVESAQKDRIFEADKLKRERLESRYAGEHNFIDVPLPSDGFQRSVDITWLLGMSGTGKTETLNRLLSIINSDVDFSRLEMVSPISISCPAIKNFEDFLMRLLGGMDNALRQNDFKTAVWGPTTKKSDIPDRIITVCLGYKLSCLIMDKVEYLLELPEVYQERIIGFLVRLSTEAGVPIVLVGNAAGWDLTFKNEALAKATFGKRPEFWTQYPNSNEWCSFTDALHQFYIGLGSALSQDVQANIYGHTQGVLTFAHTLFEQTAKSEPLLHSSGSDDVSQEDWNFKRFGASASKALAGVQAVLDALRSGDPVLLRDFKQFSPLDMDFAELNAKYREIQANKAKSAEEKPEPERPARSYADAAPEEVERIEEALFVVLRAVGEESGCQEEKVGLYIQQSIDELAMKGPKVGPYTHPKAFLKLTLAKLEAERKERAAAYQITKSKNQRNIGAKDLRWVLRAGADVGKSLIRAGYNSQPAIEKIRLGAGVGTKLL